jgi:hypothetical protein
MTAAALAAGAVLSGCSDIYYDRRDTVLLGANDAVQTNKIVQMADPWPRYSANKQIAFNGERLQTAHEHYRAGKTIAPVNVTQTSRDYQQALTQAAAASSATTQATSATPAAPVKGP